MWHAVNAEVWLKRQYHFAPNSFYPNIELNDILTLQYVLSKIIQIPPPLSDGMEYYEGIFYYEMYKSEMETERNNSSGLQDVAGLV